MPSIRETTVPIDTCETITFPRRDGTTDTRNKQVRDVIKDFGFVEDAVTPPLKALVTDFFR